MIKLRDGQGNVIVDRGLILNISEGLYESKTDNEDARRTNKNQKNRICSVGSEDVPQIEEVRKAPNQLKNEKTAGGDNITSEVLKEGRRKIPQDWNTAKKKI